MSPYAMKINLLVKPEDLQEVVGLSGTSATLVVDKRFVLIYYDLSRRHLTQIHECRKGFLGYCGTVYSSFFHIYPRSHLVSAGLNSADA